MAKRAGIRRAKNVRSGGVIKRRIGSGGGGCEKGGGAILGRHLFKATEAPTQQGKKERTAVSKKSPLPQGEKPICSIYVGTKRRADEGEKASIPRENAVQLSGRRETSIADERRRQPVRQTGEKGNYH